MLFSVPCFITPLCFITLFSVRQFEKGRTSDVPVHLYEANMLANCLADMEGTDYAILEGLIKIESTRSGNQNVSLGKIINMTYNLDNCCMAGNVSNDLELGALALETEYMDIPQEYLPLLSLEALGKQQRETEGGVYVGKYYVMESGDFRYTYHGSPTKPEPKPHFVELDLSGPEDRKMTFKLPACFLRWRNMETPCGV